MLSNMIQHRDEVLECSICGQLWRPQEISSFLGRFDPLAQFCPVSGELWHVALEARIRRMGRYVAVNA